MKFRLLLLSLCSSLFTYSQSSSNMTLAGSWYDNTVWDFNEIWGLEQGGREYAVIGSGWGTHILDITNPANIVEADRIIGAFSSSSVIHRDYHDYNGYLYAVCDEGSTSTLQIIDLSTLPNPVSVVYNSNTHFTRSHNIFIDSANAVLYSCGGDYHFASYDISNPTNPTLIKNYETQVNWWSSTIGYVHDCYVINGIGYLNNDDAMHIVDFTNPSNPIILGSINSYPDQGYNHSGWLANNGSTYVMCDETHGKRVKVLDVSNQSNIVVDGLIGSGVTNFSIPHNTLVKGNFAYTSYYHDGVYIFDISNPTSPTIAAYYDTYPGSATSNSFHGCWGVYPYLPSGKIIASDIEGGLFVFDVNISPYPTALFQASDSTPCVGETITFNNNTVNATSYQWSFPGGTPSTSTQMSPTVTYNTVGTYDVTLIATNANGNDTLIKTGYITVNPGPCPITLPPGGTAPTQTACTGKLFDDGGPSGNYTRNQDTYITIAPTGATQVDLTFISFDVEPHATCNYDYLEVYDGTSIFSPLIGRYCNTFPPPTSISSTGGAVTLYFHSDNGVHLQGFEIDWACTVPAPMPDIDFTTATATVNEAVGTVTIDVGISGAYPSPITVEVDLDAASTATNSTDFSYGGSFPATLTFPANTTGNQSLTLNITNDIIVEPTETITLNLQNPSNGNLGTVTQHTISITDNDVLPTVEFTGISKNIYETDGITTLDVSIANSNAVQTVVQINLNNSSTAINQVDFNHITPLSFPITMTFPANSTGTQSINIDLNDDNITEPTETAIFDLQVISNAQLGSNTTHTINISDGDNSGISENILPGFKVYPNPVRIGDVLKFSESITGILISAEGKEIAVINNQQEFKIGNEISQGVYILRVSKNSTFYDYKILVK